MNKALQTLRIGVGTVMVVYGLSQVGRPTEWYKYVPPWLSKLLPMPESWLMRSHGAINVGLGLVFMSGLRPVFVSYATLAWWLSILPFAFYEDWQSGMRDFAIIMAVVAVILLVQRDRSRWTFGPFMVQ